MVKYNCPICSTELNFNERYPKSICNNCCELAMDKNGRKLRFHNLSFAGGYEAIFDDTKEVYNSHICFISGIECWADEARFGGIVIEVK
jgi:hypothetical protein